VKSTELQHSIAQVVDRVVELVNPLKIILFGSAVTGHVGADSDLDLLVLVPDGQRLDEVADRLNTGIRPRPMPCDFVVATPSLLRKHRRTSGLVYAEILDHGREVYVA